MSSLTSGENTSRPVERHSLHFDFSHLDPDREYTFNHSLVAAPLRRHDQDTLAAARQKLPLLRAIPDKHLTHFIDIDLPSDCLALMYVAIPREIAGKMVQHPVHIALHIPQEGRHKARQLWMERTTTKPALHPRLARMGLTVDAVAAVLDDGDTPSFPAHINTIQDATSAAIALTFQHSNLINLNTDEGGKIPAIIEQHISDAVMEAGDLWSEILSDGDDWMQTQVLPVPGSNATTTAIVPADDVVGDMSGTLQLAIVAVKNDPALEGQQWNLTYGAPTDPYNGQTSGIPGTVTHLQRNNLEDTGYNWTASNKTGMNGLSVDASSISYSPATDTYSSAGLWSVNDTPSFSAAVVTALKGGKMYFQVNTSAYPGGLLSGVLTTGTADPDTGMIPVSGTLSLLSSVTGSSATGTVSATLNSGNTGFTYDIVMSGIDDDTVTGYFYIDGGNPLLNVNIINDSGTGTLTIEVTNKWLRHLSACVQYLDEAGNILTPQSWSDKVPGFLRHTFEPDSNKPFLALIPPVTTVFGVPIPANATQLSFPIWDEVHTVRLLMGGLGQGSYDAAVCPIGITVTVLAELVLPVFILAAGAAITNSSAVKSLLADPEVLFAVCTAGAFIAGGAGATAIALSQNPASAAKGMAAEFGPMLLSPATSLGKWVAEKIVEGAAERAAPFVDIALAVINGAVTAAELAQTIIEVLDSPFVFETDITRSMGLQVQLIPDSRYNKFPDYHSTLQVIVVYDVGNTQPTITQSLPATTLSDPITVTFSAVPAGGRLKIYAFFYAPNGWQSGQGQTSWMQASSTDGTNLVVDGLMITTNEIPLNNKSVYLHQEKTGMSGTDINWIAAVGTPPSATVTALQGSQTQQILNLASITIAQEPEMIGYSWEATGLNISPDTPNQPVSNDALWTLQNLSVLQHPQSGYAYPDVGFTDKAGIAYNIASDDNSTTNFFIDASNPVFDLQSNPAGGFHIRSLNLAHAGPAPAFDCQSNQSYGRFYTALDKYIYHPQGYIAGINFTTHKLYICKLAKSPVTDNVAVMATLASGEGARTGLLKGPTGLAAALDGRILVLESINKRVQAFDVHGAPVAYFAGSTSGSKVSTLALVDRANSTYLDIAVESQGYIYVLSYTGDGSSASMYNVDLFKPDGTFLVTTNNVPAAAITVDILRNLFTLNYENFLDGNNRPHPSVSLWLPPAPDPTGVESGASLQHSIQGTFMGKWSFTGQEGRPTYTFENDYGTSQLLMVYQVSGMLVPGYVNCVCQISAGSPDMAGPAALPFCSPQPNIQDFYTIIAEADDLQDATLFSYKPNTPLSFTSFNGPYNAPFGWFISEGWGDFFGWDTSMVLSPVIPVQVDIVVFPADQVRSNLNGIAPPGSDYSFVDLSGNDFSNLTLTGANFNNADLTGTNFDGATLTNATFNNGFSFTGASFIGANLKGAQFNNCDLSDINFSGANLNQATFTGTTLTGTIFTPNNDVPCSLQGVNFKDCLDITNCRFTGADLSNAVFYANNVKGVDFTDALLKDTTLSHIDLTQATLSMPAAFSSTIALLPDLSGSTFNYTLLGKQWSFFNLNNAIIEGLPTDLTGLDAQSASLQGLTFSQKDFTNASFKHANLQNCSLSGCNLHQADFTGASLQGDSNLRSALLSKANLKDAIFSGANLTGTDFSGAYFWGASATLAEAILVDTDFSNAYLNKVDFSGISQNQCQGCIFDYACLTNTNFQGTRAGKLSGRPASFVNACLQGADFTNAKLDGVNLSNAALSQASATFTATILLTWPNKMVAMPVQIEGATLGIQNATTIDSVCPDTSGGPCSIPQQQSPNAPKQWPANTTTEEPPLPEEEPEGNWLIRLIRWWFRFWKKFFRL